MAEWRSWRLEKRHARQVGHNLYLRWLSGHPLPKLIKSRGHAFGKIRQARSAAELPLQTPRTGKIVLAVKPRGLNFSAESNIGMNTAAGDLRLSGQSMLFFKITFPLSVI